MIEMYLILTPLIALALAGLAIKLLWVAREHPRTKKYLNQTIMDFATAGIVIYTVCAWVIGVIAAHFAVWIKSNL